MTTAKRENIEIKLKTGHILTLQQHNVLQTLSSSCQKDNSPHYNCQFGNLTAVKHGSIKLVLETDEILAYEERDVLEKFGQVLWKAM